MATLRITLALVPVLALACKAPEHRTDQSHRPDDQPVGTTETRSSPTLVSPMFDAGGELPLEGRLSFQAPGKPGDTIDFAVWGDKVRIGTAGVEAIVDRKSKEATIVARDKKRYERVSLDELREPKADDLGKNVKVDKSGKTSFVSGHTCEEWTLTGAGETVRACVLHAGPAFDLQAAAKRSGANPPPAWLDRIVDEGYVPIRVAIGDVATEWTTSRVDPLVFEPPKGFEKK